MPSDIALLSILLFAEHCIQYQKYEISALAGFWHLILRGNGGQNFLRRNAVLPLAHPNCEKSR
jgi:hypothetical protein